MINSLNILIKHMEEEHPDSKIFRDSCCFDINRKVISQKCFICGKELIINKDKDIDMIMNRKLDYHHKKMVSI